MQKDFIGWENLVNSLFLSISEYNPFQRDFKFSILVLYDSVINELFFICGAV